MRHIAAYDVSLPLRGWLRRISAHAAATRANTVLHQVALYWRASHVAGHRTGTTGTSQRKTCLARCAWSAIGEEFLYCVKAAGSAGGTAASGWACGLRPVPPSATVSGESIGFVGLAMPHLEAGVHTGHQDRLVFWTTLTRCLLVWRHRH